MDRKSRICGAHEPKLNVRCVEFQVVTILVRFYRNKLVLRREVIVKGFIGYGISYMEEIVKDVKINSNNNYDN